uniref:Cyclin-dependent kinase inhibitor domain-containing protein n=1 Tax=Hippocampus comes TaxID=109280 RepID=A0A3Q2YC92_HIPCM
MTEPFLRWNFPVRLRASTSTLKTQSLFGRVDHEQLHREMKLKFLEISQEDFRRWNFNFKTETPLPGRFEWEKIPPDCTVALHHESSQQKYTSPVLAAEDEDGPAETEEDRSDQENCPGFSNQCAAEVTPVRRKRMPPKAKENAQITGRKRCPGLLRQQRLPTDKSRL